MAYSVVAMQSGIILGGSAPARPNSALALQAKSRWNIPNEVPTDQEVQDDLVRAQPALELDQGQFPNIVLRSLGGPYNCVGLVFASRRTMIDAEYIERILREDGYRRVDRALAMVGDVVVYRQAPSEPPTHVGLLIERSIALAESAASERILSKWGRHPEYVHAITDVRVEQYGAVHEFWTDRRTR